MANFETLKAAIRAVIKQNGNNEITGDLLQQSLLSMISSLGANYQYAGIASPSLNPGTPDQNVFYIATTRGTYTNFGGLTVADGEIGILKYNGTWVKDSTAGYASFNDLMRYIFSGGDIFRNDGYIDYNSGLIAAYSSCVNTDFLIIDRNSDIEIKNIGGPGGMAGIFFYDENFAPIQAQKQTPSAHILIEKENIPENAVYFRSSTQKSYITNDTSVSFFSVESLLQMFSPIENIDKLNVNREILRYVYNKDIFSVDNSYINTDGSLATGYSPYKATPFLPILKDNDVVVRGVGGQGGSLAIAFYDENQFFISSFDYTNYVMYSDIKEYVVQKANIPANAKYIRSSLQKTYESDDTFVVCANVYSLFSKVTELEINVSEMAEIVSQVGPLIDTTKSYGAAYFVNVGYINNNGYTTGTYSDTKYTDFIPVNAGDVITANLGVNTQIGAIVLYKNNQMTAENVSRVITGGQLQELTQVELTATVTAVEKYVRFCSSKSLLGTITILSPGQFSGLLTLGDLFDYSKVLTMPKQLVRSLVETASNGLCTAIYDNNGFPSLMYRIPIISLGALNGGLGDLTTPHPAFVVGGVQKKEIFMACFQTTVYEGVPVSWFGLAPTNGSLSFAGIRTASKNKGTGWHLETIYERSLAILLSVKMNGTKARGNTMYGRTNVAGYEYESVLRQDGALPGTNVFAAKWINGTQPLKWAHNNERFGIFDLIGGYWEWCDLVKVVNGQIYLAADNDFGADENTWIATGAYMDVDADGVISFNNSFNPNAAAGIVYTSWESILCQAGYDTLTESLRKKLQQLLICPRLSSQDAAALLDFNGKFWMKKDQTNYLIHGGAEEYPGCGFGEFAISYPATESHGNMGSRLCYIEM